MESFIKPFNRKIIHKLNVSSIDFVKRKCPVTLMQEIKTLNSTAQLCKKSLRVEKEHKNQSF